MTSHNNNQVPKILHWVWVGPSEPPKIVTECMATWSLHLGHLEWKKWEESNSPMEHPFVANAYKRRLWAFASDYIRFWAIEKFGGIYIDCDTEVLKDLGPIIEKGPFVGTRKSGDVQAGIFGFPAGHPVVKDILAQYEQQDHADPSFTSPVAFQRALANHSGSDVTLYDWTYFYPTEEGESLSPAAAEIAYTNHRWAESWVPAAGLRKIARRIGIMPLIKQLKNSL